MQTVSQGNSKHGMLSILRASLKFLHCNNLGKGCVAREDFTRSLDYSVTSGVKSATKRKRSDTLKLRLTSFLAGIKKLFRRERE